MSSARILLVEDDASGRALAAFNLQRGGYEVEAVASGEDALALFAPGRHDLVLTDVRMEKVSGLELLRAVKGRSPDTPVVVMTAYAEVDLAVDAMKAGAADFLGKPFSRDHLLITVERALASRRMAAELDARRRSDPARLDAASPAMKEALALLDAAAEGTAPVWIHGASGTGKSAAATRLHRQGRRVAGAMVSFLAGAHPPESHEARLFGEGGAIGLARRGTLVIEDVEALAGPAQGRLAGLVDAGDDLRLVVTSRHAPAEAAAAGLAEGLAFRLAATVVKMPALAERGEELELLVRAALDRLAPGQPFELEPGLIEALRARPWPGNLRELHSAVERLVTLSDDGVLRADRLPAIEGGAGAAEVDDPLGSWPELPEGGISLVDLERRVIARVLALKRDNITHAAAYLGVPRHVLAYRMEKYGLRRRRD